MATLANGTHLQQPYSSGLISGHLCWSDGYFKIVEISPRIVSNPTDLCSRLARPGQGGPRMRSEKMSRMSEMLNRMINEGELSVGEAEQELASPLCDADSREVLAGWVLSRRDQG